MNARNTLVISSLSMHGVSLVLHLDAIHLVLVAIFIVLALVTWRARDTSGASVTWLFSGLALVAYSVLFAYTAIPRTGHDPVVFLVSVMNILASLAGVIANTLSLELGNEE